MKCSTILLSILFLYTTAETVSNNWAVLIAGSDGFSNYRHQSDVFHAYQILISQGYSKDKIIVFAYDDVVLDPLNKFPGKIFNSPNGKDVYEGVVIDYKGNDVTPQNYINVILGEEEKMKGIGSGRVLKSTKEDNVFLFFDDHGASKLIVFPQHVLFKEPQMFELLSKLHEKHNYNKVVFYVEACYSGSMFLRLPKTWNIWVTTAANANQSSYATFCGSSARVQGVLMNTCLGDEYSVAWMEDVITNKDNSGYTLFRQFENLKKRVKGSEVCTFGDIEYAQNNAIEVIFKSGAGSKWKDWDMTLDDDSNDYNESDSDFDNEIIDSRDAYLYSMKYRAMTANDPWAVYDYKKELLLTKRSKSIFERFRKELGLKEGIVNGVTDFDCLDLAYQGYKDECGFGERDIRYLNDLTNACTIDVEPEKVYETIINICRLPEFKK